MDVDLLNTDSYQWSGRLVDSNKTEIDFAGKSGFLSRGINTIDIFFDGHKIGGKGVNGPYTVTGFLMLGAGNSIIASDVAITKFYKFTDFEGVLNHSPIANAGPDQILECANPSGTPATLDGSASSDPDNDPLTYTWTGVLGPASGVSPIVLLPTGISAIILVVNDGQVDSPADTVNIAVEDTTPPHLFAQWIPLEVEDDEGKFRLEFFAEDACDSAVNITGVIQTPPLTGLTVELKIKIGLKIEFDLNKGKVEIQGPDPQALLSQLQKMDGIVVNNGQIVGVELGDHNKKFEIKVKEDGNLKIEAASVNLLVTGKDSVGNVSSTISSPVFEDN